MLSELRRRFAAPRSLDTVPALRDFVGERAAFISQKCTVEYCRARAGLLWASLFREQPFLDALERSRWQAYAAVLLDVTVLVEGKLREPAGEAGGAGWLVPALERLVALNLSRFPDRGAVEGGWTRVVEQARERLGQAQLAPPQPAHRIGYTGGRAIYEALPFHPSVRAHDETLVVNNVRFNLCRAAEDFERQAKPEALVADLRRLYETSAAHGSPASTAALR